LGAEVATGAEVAGVLDSLLAARLVLAVDGRLLGLALRGPVPALPAPDSFPGGYVDVGSRPAHAG